MLLENLILQKFYGRKEEKKVNKTKKWINKKIHINTWFYMLKMYILCVFFYYLKTKW